MYQSPYSQFNQPFGQFQQPTLPVLQQPVQNTPNIPQGIMGRTVMSDADIAANDVPMNGSPAYFPRQDGTVIYARQWNPDGSITTVRYIPDVPQQEETEQTPTLLDIANQLDDIQSILKAERKPATTSRRSTKKETNDDDSE